MKKCFLLLLLLNLCVSNNYAKNQKIQDETSPTFASTKDLTAIEKNLKKEIREIFYTMAQKIENFKEKEVIIKLYQNINSEQFKSAPANSTTVTHKILEVIKNLTSPVAITSAAWIAITAVVYKMITSQELRRLLEEIASMHKWNLGMQGLSYVKWLVSAFACLKFM